MIIFENVKMTYDGINILRNEISKQDAYKSQTLLSDYWNNQSICCYLLPIGLTDSLDGQIY